MHGSSVVEDEDSTRPPTEVPKFNGSVPPKGKSAVTCGQFVSCIESLAKQSGWTNEELVSNAMEAMQGPALDWASSYTANDCNADGLVQWPRFKEALMEKFSSRLSISEKVELRRGLKQRTNESVTDFHARCELVQYLICDDSRDVVFEREILLNFILGLKKGIQKFVIKSTGKTLTEFVQAAIDAQERVVKAKQERRTTRLSTAKFDEPDYDMSDAEYFDNMYANDDDGEEHGDDKKLDDDEEEEGEGEEEEELMEDANGGEKSLAPSDDVKVEIKEEDQLMMDHEGGGVYICDVCDITFNEEKQLLSHVERKHKYKCKECKKTFKQKQIYVTHMQEKHAETVISCPDCSAVFFDEMKSLLHQSFQHEEVVDDKYTCPLCREPQRKYSMKNHINRVHFGQEKVFTCNVCSKSFYDKNRLEKHTRVVHLMERSFECQECHKMFKTKSHWRIHMRDIHKQVEEVMCSQCPKSFTCKAYLSDHMKRMHQKEQSVCEECGASCKSKDSLRRHMALAHNGQGAISCPYEGCTTRNVTQSGMRIHIQKVHEKREGNERCTFCPKAFWSKSRLKSHIDGVHLGNKPHKCPHCSFETAYRSHIGIHIRANHDQVKYTCPFPMCNHQASYKGNLDKHIRNVHKN